MAITASIQASRLRVMARATRRRNVSATCRRFGISGTPFSRGRHRVEPSQAVVSVRHGLLG